MSLNEVEALAKTAARGAGYAWGLAEEAGVATRWLSARSVDGLAVLAAVLVERDGVDYEHTEPVLGESWNARGGAGLCPIATGCALSDHADVLPPELRIVNVMRPVLLAPFVAGCARHLSSAFVLDWDGARVVTDGDALFIEGDANLGSADVVVTRKAEVGALSPQPTSTRAMPDSDSLALLKRFAQRTYAPATEASRLSGAGARLSDND